MMVQSRWNNNKFRCYEGKEKGEAERTWIRQDRVKKA